MFASDLFKQILPVVKDAVGSKEDTNPATSTGILGPTDIGTFTAPTVTAKKPTLTTDPNAAIFKDVSPGYNLTSYGMDPYATSSLYADQLARETGARGLRPDEIDTFVTGAYENVLGRAPDAAGAEYWGSQLAAGTKPPGEIAQDFIAAAQANNETVLKDKYGQYAFPTLPTYGPSMPAPQQLTMGKPVQDEEGNWVTPGVGTDTTSETTLDTSGTTAPPLTMPEGIVLEDALRLNPDLGAAGIDTEEEFIDWYYKWGKLEPSRVYSGPSPEPAPEPMPEPVPEPMPEPAPTPTMPEGVVLEDALRLNPDLGAAGIDTQQEFIDWYNQWGKNEPSRVYSKSAVVNNYMKNFPGVDATQVAQDMKDYEAATGIKITPEDIKEATGLTPMDFLMQANQSAETFAEFDEASGGLMSALRANPADTIKNYMKDFPGRDATQVAQDLKDYEAATGIKITPEDIKEATGLDMMDFLMQANQGAQTFAEFDKASGGQLSANSYAQGGPVIKGTDTLTDFLMKNRYGV